MFKSTFSYWMENDKQAKNEFDTFLETEINGALSTSFTVQFRESCWRSEELIIATNINFTLLARLLQLKSLNTTDMVHV